MIGAVLVVPLLSQAPTHYLLFQLLLQHPCEDSLWLGPPGVGPTMLLFFLFFSKMVSNERVEFGEKPFLKQTMESDC